MNKIALVLCFLLTAAGLCRAATPAANVVVAYVFVEDGLVDPDTVAVEKVTHINYAFADIRGGVMVEGFRHDAENMRRLLSLKRRNPRLTVMVSVGGWTWSGQFSDMTRTHAARARFIDSAVEFLARHDLDGLDIDWEYPGLPGFGNTHRPEDKRNFTLLCRELRQRLDREGKKRGKRYLLTAAVGAFPDFLAHTEMKRVQKYLDLVNLMTYDFAEAEADPQSTHHAGLFLSPGAPSDLSADRAVRDFLAAGVPAEKLVLGVPFYGRAWGEVEGGTNGLFGRGKGVRLDTNYADLAAQCVDRNGFVRLWDDTAKAPYLWNAQRRIFVSYEDPQSLAEKCRYIRRYGLRGVMFWEYSADTIQHDLLNVLARELLAR